MVDLITYVTRMPAKGETIEAPTFEMGCGGKGANQAVAAAKLGADVLIVTKVGDDMFGENTIRNFASFGIDTRHVSKVQGKSSGVAPIMVEPSGENSILIVKAQRRPPARRHRAGRRGSQDLQPDPASARNSSGDGLCGHRIRQAARDRDAAQSDA